MLSLSEIHQEVARFSYKNIKYPKTDKQIYWQYFFKLEKHFEALIEDIYEQSRDITFPIDTFPIENYLVGCKIHYIPFDNLQMGNPDLEGWREENPDNPYEIYVMYNVRASMERQRFTQVHETFHILQQHDPEYCTFLDSFFDNPEILPLNLVYKLMERIADKAVEMYLMPKNELEKQYKLNANIEYLKNYFQVSRQALIYRLKNTGILIPT